MKLRILVLVCALLAVLYGAGAFGALWGFFMLYEITMQYGLLLAGLLYGALAILWAVSGWTSLVRPFRPLLTATVVVTTAVAGWDMFRASYLGLAVWDVVECLLILALVGAVLWLLRAGSDTLEQAT